MPNYRRVESVDELEMLVDMLVEEGLVFGFDIETGYIGPDKDQASIFPEYPDRLVVGFSFTNSLDWAVYVPLAHDLYAHNLPADQVAPLLWKLLQTGLGVAHNLKFELRQLSRFFRELLPASLLGSSNGYYPFTSCSQIEVYVHAQLEEVGLKSVVKQMFKHQMTDYSDLFIDEITGKKPVIKRTRFNLLDVTPKVITYACEDALWCLAVHLRVNPQIKDRFIYKLEMKILPLLCEMEEEGLETDWEFLRLKGQEAETFAQQLNAEIQENLSTLLGESVSINLNSPAQLQKLFYTQLGLPVTRTVKKSGAPSTDATTIELLAKRHPAIARISRWKELSKLLGSYLKKYERDYRFAPDDRVHASVKQTTVGAGRFAVADYNYQQFPKKYFFELEDGSSTFEMKFRDCILSPAGYYIMGFDFSQMELRVIAGLAGETYLLDAFNSGRDVHTETAMLMFNLAREQVTEDFRAKGKTFNFALAFQQGVKATAEQLGIPVDEAQALQDKYFEALSEIGAWVSKVQYEGRRDGYVSTFFGRTVPIWEFFSDNEYIRSKGSRLCVNAPAQGTAADYMKLAMLKARAKIRNSPYEGKIKMVMNIHDALEFYVHKSVSPQEVYDLLHSEVTFPVKGLPEVVAEWHLGHKWGSVMDLTVEDDVLMFSPFKDKSGNKFRYLQDTWAFARGEVELVATPVEKEEAKTAEVKPEPPLIVEIVKMPTAEQFKQFKELVAYADGPRVLVLRTPQGDVGFPTTTSLGTRHEKQISLLLGGARVFDAKDVLSS